MRQRCVSDPDHQQLQGRLYNLNLPLGRVVMMANHLHFVVRPQVFAYGQTGTGKTHTMEGDLSSDDQKGVIPRAVEVSITPSLPMMPVA